MPGEDNFESILLDALENISESFVIYDRNGFLVTCNDNFRKLYNYSEKEATPGIHYQELGRLDIVRGNIVVRDEDGTSEDYFACKGQYRQKLEGTFVVQLKDQRWIKITDRRLSDGGFVSIQSDVTEEKHNARLLNEAKQAAELANRAKSEFIANMSHELRTPMNAIIGFSSLLASEVYGDHSDPRYQEYAADIEGAGDHLLTLINEILDLAKVEAGAVTLIEKKIDIWQLSQSCKTLVSARAKEKNIKVDIVINPPALALYADPIRIKQILVNLASNAVKFSDPGNRIVIDWQQNNGRVSLMVKDFGMGIEQEFLPHLYEPFRRSKIAKDRQCEGTGLGLTLVKKFSDAHEAKMRIESQPGDGTTVTLNFPKHRTLEIQEELAS
ncbi:MAG: ATP-binding protein [Sneathiella sp.]